MVTMSSKGYRVSQAFVVARRSLSAGPIVKRAAQGLLFAASAVGLFWLVTLYGNGLRDARYLDGWVLAGGMLLQLAFHISLKVSRLSPKAAKRFRALHIQIGYVLVVVFALHSDFSLPDTAFEWVIWVGFVLVTVTGILGTYLAWVLRGMGRADESIGYERIPLRRAELARDLRVIIDDGSPYTGSLDLPALPHDAWISGLYDSHLRDYFGGRRNYMAHLFGSRRSLTRVLDEIDDLSRYVDLRAQGKLAAIKQLVIEKHQLDGISVHLGLTRAWLMVHVPVTHVLVVLTIAHVLVVYAFSSGSR